MPTKDLILLHGALGAAAQLQPLKTQLEGSYNCHLINFEGHGGRPAHAPFEIDLFTNNVIDYIVSYNLEKPCVFGYSMGGYVALSAALQGVDFSRIMTLGTKFDWNPESALREIKMLQPDIIEEKIPKYAMYQNSLHAPEDWKKVMRNTAELIIRLGANPLIIPENLEQVQQPVLCSRGADDEMVTESETVKVVNALPVATYYEFSDFKHPIEKINIEILAKKIQDFMH